MWNEHQIQLRCLSTWYSKWEIERRYGDVECSSGVISMKTFELRLFQRGPVRESKTRTKTKETGDDDDDDDGNGRECAVKWKAYMIFEYINSSLEISSQLIANFKHIHAPIIMCHYFWLNLKCLHVCVLLGRAPNWKICVKSHHVWQIFYQTTILALNALCMDWR